MTLDKRSILIPDGDGDIALFVVRALSLIQGWKIHVLAESEASPLRFSRGVSTFARLQPEESVAQIAAAVRRLSVDVVMPVAERMHALVSENRDILAQSAALVPLANPALHATVINKWTLNEMLLRHEFPSPKTVLLTLDQEGARKIQGLDFPVLMKPILGADGRGIQKYFDPESLFRAIEQGFYRAGEWIVQTWIKGHDVDCNLLCRDGKILAYSIQKGFIFRKRPYTPPAGIEFFHDEKVLELVRRWAAAVGWSGVAHIDLRVDETDGSIKILEVNARYWGSLLGSATVGVNFPYLACLAALGVPFEPPDYAHSKYVSGVEAISAWAANIFHPRNSDWSLRDTSWRYAAADPLAELVRFGSMATRRVR